MQIMLTVAEQCLFNYLELHKLQTSIQNLKICLSLSCLSLLIQVVNVSHNRVLIFIMGLINNPFSEDIFVFVCGGIFELHFH